jgi:YihY family inner membrane protein
MGVVSGIDHYQRRHRWAGFPVAVVYKFFDDQGGYLAALITYYGFLSLFPLLLLAVTILGFVLQGDPALQQKVLGSALQQFPVVGPQLRDNVQAMRGSGLGLAIGALVSLYGGLGFAQASQAALNRVWGVPRNERANPLISRGRSLAVVVVFAAAVVLTTVLSAVGASAAHFGADLGAGVRIMAIVLAFVANVAMFVLVFRLLTARQVPTRDMLSGAVIAGSAGRSC